MIGKQIVKRFGEKTIQITKHYQSSELVLVRDADIISMGRVIIEKWEDVYINYLIINIRRIKNKKFYKNSNNKYIIADFLSKFELL